MTELSPAAQAIWDAWWKANNRYAIQDLVVIVRAAADQVVPEVTTPWNSTLTPIVSVREIRAKLLSIAAELEGSPTEHNLFDKDDAPWLDCMDGFKQLTAESDNKRVND